MALPPTNPPQWLHWLESCPSTNTWALAHNLDGSVERSRLEHGDVVFTQQQTAGRGQHGRTWYAPPGVLTASIILDSIPAAHLPTLSLAAGLAVIYAIEDLLPSSEGLLRLKWPNDVLWQGRKLAGILCEASTTGAVGRAVVGIGLNRHVDFDQAGLDASAVGQPMSLHQISPIVPDEISLLERLRHYLLQTAGLLRSDKHTHNSTGLSVLLPALRSRDALIGHPITIQLDGVEISGEAAGINDRGHLLLQLPKGEVRSFVSGHILSHSHVSPQL